MELFIEWLGAALFLSWFAIAALATFEFILWMGGASGLIGEAIRRLRNEIRWRRRPLVYVCEHNGVIAVVRAKDYDRCMRQHWRRVERDWGKNALIRGCRPHPEPQLHFSVKPSEPMGNLGEMQSLLAECRIEPRQFTVPAPWSAWLICRSREVYCSVDAYRLVYGKQRGRKLYREHVDRLTAEAKTGF